MKRFIVVAILVVSYLSTTAQRGIEAGAVVQPHLYDQLYDEAILNKEERLAYNFAIGINAGYNFTDYFGIRTGFIYSPQGERYTISNPVPEQSFDLNLEYLQVPLYLKLNGNPDNKISFLALAGPHISYLNNATLTIDTEDPVSVLGDYKRFLIGASVGLGFQLNLDRGGNINFLWRTAASIDTIQEVDSVLSRNITSGFQLAYNYFITW